MHESSSSERKLSLYGITIGLGRVASGVSALVSVVEFNKSNYAGGVMCGLLAAAVVLETHWHNEAAVEEIFTASEQDLE